MIQLPTTTNKTEIADIDGARRIVAELGRDLQVEAGRDTLTRLPTKAEREVLKNYYAHLSIEIRPINYTKHDPKLGLAGAAIAEMLNGFPNYNPDPESRDKNGKPDGRQKAVGFLVMKLADFPLFAIKEACKDIEQRRVKDISPHFVPTLPFLYERCQHHAAPVKYEHGIVKRILMVTAKRIDRPDDPVMKDRLNELFSGLSSELSALNERDRREDEIRRAQEAEKYSKDFIKREYVAHGQQPKPYSMSLQRRIEEWREEERIAALRKAPPENYKDQGS